MRIFKLLTSVAVVAGVATVSGAQTVPAPAVPSLTIAAAVTQALAQNARLLDADDSVEQAKLGMRLAQADFKPKITPNVLGSFGQSDISNQTYGLDVSQRLPTGTTLKANVGAATARNQLGDFYTTDTTFLVSQSLLRGFGTSVTTRNVLDAESRSLDAARQRTLTEQQLALEVASAYYAIVTQQELVQLAERALERSRRLLEASRAKMTVGRVSQLDVYRAEQLVTQADGQLLDARAAVEDAMDRLRVLMGYASDYRFQVVGDVPLKTETISPEEAAERARQHRPEIQSADAALADADRAVHFTQNQALPQFDVNFALTRRDTATSLRTSFGVDHFRFATFFGVSMPLDRTPQSIALQTAQMERERRNRAVQLLRLRIEGEARRAVRQQDRLVKSLANADASVDFATKEVELANLRYERGLSNNLDVVNAESNLLAARARRTGALAELAVARLQVLAAVGTLDPRADIQ